MGEIGEDLGQIAYVGIEAVVGTKGAGLAMRGVRTGAQVGLNATRGLVGAQRLAQIAAYSGNRLIRLTLFPSKVKSLSTVAEKTKTPERQSRFAFTIFCR